MTDAFGWKWKKKKNYWNWTSIVQWIIEYSGNAADAEGVSMQRSHEVSIYQLSRH